MGSFQYDWGCHWALWKFNTKRCPDEIFFGNSHDQPIPSNYCDFLNDDYDDENNIPCSPVEDVPPDQKKLEDSVVPNDEETDDEIIIDDADSPTVYIDPLQNEILNIEVVDA